MPEHDATAIILVKSKPGKEALVEQGLKRVFAKRCSTKCRRTNGGRVCENLDFRVLGHALGRFDFALIVQGSRARDVHGLVLQCIRKNLAPRVLDTETSYVYNILTNERRESK